MTDLKMTDLKMTELNFLNALTNTYASSESPQNKLMTSLALKIIKPYLLENSKALEIGCWDGGMTSGLASFVSDFTVVEGSEVFIKKTKSRFPKNVKFIHSLFEDFSSEDKYDIIFATYLLEHVVDPVLILKKAKSLLAKNGLIFIVVPNARAFSRQLALNMGILKDLYSLTDNDINHGHRRVYDRHLLNKDIKDADLNVVSQGGILFKILADFQMDQLIASGLIGELQQQALYQMGLDYPDFSGSIYSICSL
jgi:2-polyprenyl-3-methyl-5-hydroxy-6-metoxy-1,4-benzoquinol methylase